MSYRQFFNHLNKSKSGLLNYGDFNTGFDQIHPLSIVVKEKLFAEMDSQKIGLVSYD